MMEPVRNPENLGSEELAHELAERLLGVLRDFNFEHGDLPNEPLSLADTSSRFETVRNTVLDILASRVPLAEIQDEDTEVTSGKRSAASKLVPAPRVFLSHAHEDKERFVLGFAKRLREAGIDVWLDRWEIYPGDSLVDRIFEEGIKDAQAMIVVLSSNSVNKDWVREELNLGVIRKIEGKCRLIPIVIDDCEIPEALKSTFWQVIGDLEDYDVELERVVMSIYGYRQTPELGPSPAYVSKAIETVPGLSLVDSLVLKVSCEIVVNSEENQVGTHELIAEVSALDVPEEEAAEAIEMLDRQGYIDGTRLMPVGLAFYSITSFGFNKYASTYLPQYDDLVRSVSLAIVRDGETVNTSIAEALGQPQILVDLILDVLQSRRLLDVHKFMGGGSLVSNVSLQLRRLMQEI
jgi:TIR domain